MTSDRVLLYMWDPFRRRLVEELDFFKEQADQRLLSQFENISQEAEAHAQEVYEASGACFNPECHDAADFVGSAQDAGIRFYELLDDMRRQTIFSVAAGMYHQFEIKLRDFLVREFQKSFSGEKLKQKLWRQEISKIFDLVEGCGWKVRNEPFFEHIDACRLVVNVYKHGDGKSLDELLDKYPKYLRSPFNDDNVRPWTVGVDYTSLTVGREDLCVFHHAFRDFWNSIPVYTHFSDAVGVPEWVGNAIMSDREASD
ncbi:hypothetical protein ROS1_57750 [Roseibium sp. ROS1]